MVSGYWVAAIRLADGKSIRRKRHSREDAEAALTALLTEYADYLGYFYDLPRRPSRRHRGSPRSGVTKRVRFLILERDGFRCRYCGATPDVAELVIDHVIPVADGGSDEPDNLATACGDCNAGKGGRPLLTPLPTAVAS
jgi:hypothetical protein